MQKVGLFIFFIAFVVANASVLEEYLLRAASPRGEGSRSTTTTTIAKGCPVVPSPVEVPNLRSLMDETIQKMDGLMDETIRNSGNVSLSVAVVYKGRIVWGKGYGYLDPTKPARGVPDLNSRYRIGSLTKVFTDMMFLKLRDQGKISIDDTVEQYWPNFKPKGKGDNSRPITFWQLARQMSGLPSASPCNYFVNCDITTDQAFAIYSDNEVAEETDWSPHYSDGAYGVLGRGLEKIAATTWERWTQQNILDPLNMINTGFDINSTVVASMPIPHMGGIVLPSALSHLNMKWPSPTGQMWSSVNDLVSFFSLFLKSHDKNADNSIINASSLREALLIDYANPDSASAWATPFEMVFSPAASRWITSKGGLFPGYSGWVGMIPPIQAGLVVLTADITGLVAGQQMADLYFAKLLSILEENQPPPAIPSNYTSFIGNYTASVFGIYPMNLQVRLSNDSTKYRGHPQLEYLFEGSPEGSKMVWNKGNDFQTVVDHNTLGGPDNSGSCIGLQVGNNHEYVRFQTDPKNPSVVVSLTLPLQDPFFGFVFKKR